MHEAVMVTDKEKIIPYMALRQHMTNLETLMATYDVLLKINGKSAHIVSGEVSVDEETEKTLKKLNGQIHEVNQKIQKLILDNF